MLNIVCVCHNGMGTSMLLKINVNNICMENGIMLPPTDAKIVTTTNMLNKDEVTGLLVNCVKENFPGEM